MGPTVDYSWILPIVFLAPSIHLFLDEIHCLLLTHAPNAFAASRETKSRTLERAARLHLLYFRDHLGVVSFSFFSDGSNISDAGANVNSPSHLWITDRLLNR